MATKMKTVGRRLYYVTEDLSALVRRWCESRVPALACPPEAVFASLKDALLSNLRQAFSKPVEEDDGQTTFDVDVRYIERRQLKTLQRDNDDGEFWIALDDICVPRADCYLDLCRLYDEDGTKIGVGGRPLGQTVDTQLFECERAYSLVAAKKPVVVLADDGTYTGGSVVEGALLLKKSGINVQRINLGFCTNEGADVIQERLPGVEVSADRLVDKTRHVYTWVCERDFYLGAPRSGKPYGLMQVSRPIPSSVPVAFCYLEPFAASRRGGNIKKGLFQFSRDQIRGSVDLWRAIEELNSCELRVRDVPRFPGPGLDDAYHRYADMKWLDYLELVATPMVGPIDRGRP